jgi:hypothetical protein
MAEPFFRQAILSLDYYQIDGPLLSQFLSLSFDRALTSDQWAAQHSPIISRQRMIGHGDDGRGDRRAAMTGKLDAEAFGAALKPFGVMRLVLPTGRWTKGAGVA